MTSLGEERGRKKEREREGKKERKKERERESKRGIRRLSQAAHTVRWRSRELVSYLLGMNLHAVCMERKTTRME